MTTIMRSIRVYVARTQSSLSQATKRYIGTATSVNQQHGRRVGTNVLLLAGAAVAASVTAATIISHAQVQAEPASDASTPSNTPSTRSHSASILACHKELSTLLGERFSTDASDLASHGVDAFSYHKGGEEEHPSGVAFALSTEEVSEIVKICSKHRVIMIPYGSGTSLEGHTSAPHGGVCIDLSRMQSVKRVNVDDMDCIVDAGISWNNLNTELKPYGLFFPVDPGPGASIGGMVGTSCSGTNAVRYGTMKQNVLSLTVVLPNGEIVKTANRARKSSAGYDLTRLFIGSEGTLGIVTEITLRLQNIPESTAVATTSFGSITEASNATMRLMQKGVRVGCVELLDDGCIEAVNVYSGLNYPLRPATLFFKFHGSPEAVKEEIALASAISRTHGSGEFLFATDADARERLWEARKGALWACMAFREGCEAWTTDVCVPISRMAECIEQTKKDLVELDLDESGEIQPAFPSISSAVVESRRVHFPSGIVGHVGDGNFHVIMMLDPNSPAELKLAAEINRRMIKRAIAMDGTCTGEHGVGVGKKEYMELEHGAPAMNLMRRIKHAVDPHAIMNPGKIFDPIPPVGGGACIVTADGSCEIPLKPRKLNKQSPPCC